MNPNQLMQTQLNPLDLFKLWSISPRLAILDTETTGLGTGDEIIEVTAINGTGEILFVARVKPTCPIDPTAGAVHGITLDDLQHAPSFKEVLPLLTKALTGYRVVAYGANFDVRLIQQTAEAHGIITEEDEDILQAECVMYAYAKFWGEPGKYNGPKWQSLTNACKQQGVDTSDLPEAHTSEGDCIRTLRLIQAVAQKWEG